MLFDEQSSIYLQKSSSANGMTPYLDPVLSIDDLRLYALLDNLADSNQRVNIGTIQALSTNGLIANSLWPISLTRLYLYRYISIQQKHTKHADIVLFNAQISISAMFKVNDDYFDYIKSFESDNFDDQLYSNNIYLEMEFLISQSVINDDTLNNSQSVINDDTLNNSQSVTNGDTLNKSQSVINDDTLNNSQSVINDDTLNKSQSVTNDDTLNKSQSVINDDTLTSVNDIQTALKQSLTANFDSLDALNDSNSAKSEGISNIFDENSDENQSRNSHNPSDSNTLEGVSLKSNLESYSSSCSIYIKPTTTVNEISAIIKSQKYDITDLTWNSAFSEKQKNYIFKNITHNKLTAGQAQSVVDVFAHKFKNKEPIQHLPAFLNTLVRSAKDGLLMPMEDIETGGVHDAETKQNAQINNNLLELRNHHIHYLALIDNDQLKEAEIYLDDNDLVFKEGKISKRSS